LINTLASQIWEIDVNEESLMVFKGSYQEYQVKQKGVDYASEGSLDLDENPPAYKDHKLTKNQLLAERRKRTARLNEIEKRIATLEDLISSLGKKLVDPPKDPDLIVQLGLEYKDAEKELETLLEEWEILQENTKDDL
jgi:hypothetical protein